MSSFLFFCFFDDDDDDDDDDDVAFSEYHAPLTFIFIFVRRVRCASSFRLVFVYLVTTGWILTSAYVGMYV